MADDNRLLVRLEVTTSQLEKRMNRIVNLMAKQAGDVNNAWKRSNSGIVKNAEQSAEAIGREMDRLRAKYDPVYAASKRYEKALIDLNRAHKVGAIDTARYDAALERLNADFARSSANTTGMKGAARGLGAAMSGAQYQIQNAAFQIGDFAVQVGAGQRASTALAQQLPQLLGSFGALGAVMGAVVAIGVPLATYFLSAGDAGEDLTKKIENLETAVSDYSSSVADANISTAELEQKYGSASEAAHVFLVALRELNEAQGLDQIGIAVDGIIGKFGSVSIAADDVSGKLQMQQFRITISNISEELGITKERARDVYEALRDLSQAGSLDAKLQGISNLQSVLQSALGPLDQLRGDTREYIEEVAKVGEKFAEMQGSIEESRSSILDFGAAVVSAVGGMDGLISKADTLAGSMFNAAAAAWDYAYAAARSEALDSTNFIKYNKSGLKDTITTPSSLESDSSNPFYKPKNGSGRGSGGSRSGGSRSGGGGRADSNPFFEDAEKQIAALERQIEMIGKTDREVASLTAKYKLLDEAKKRGLNLDKVSAETGRTLRAEIELRAEAIGKLTEAMDRQNQVSEFSENIINDISDAAAAALLQTENLGEAFNKMLQQMVADVISSNIKNILTDALTPSGGGGGGFFAKLFGGLLFSANGNVFSGGSQVQAYADGGVVSGPTVFPMTGGKTGLMGEAGPEAIMPLTRIGGKLGVQAQGGAVDVVVRVDDSGQMRAAIEGISGNVAARVVQANNAAVTQAQRRR